MIGGIVHVGITVSDMDRSLAFYRDVLGLTFQGEMQMGGPESEALFVKKNAKARVAYLNGSTQLAAPPVELIQFIPSELDKTPMDLFRTGVSEICFGSSDLDADYERLKALGVEFLSEPQIFDSTAYGMGRSKAVYLRDPDGTILELLQPL